MEMWRKVGQKEMRIRRQQEERARFRRKTASQQVLGITPEKKRIGPL